MRKYIFLLICVLICFVSCADYEANISGKLQVVSIGLNYNETGASFLKGPINDATEFGAAMSAIMNAKGVPRNVIYMLQENAPEERNTYPTKNNVVNMISSLELNSNDLLTIFYSGHGQVVCWTKCNKCGQEYVNGTDEEKVCFVCNNNHVVFCNLTAYLSEETGSLAQSAKNYLDGTITKDAYISALREDGSARANEILAVADYSEEPCEDLNYKTRGFLVTAPENPVAFEDFAKEYIGQNTLFSAIAQKMQNDAARPNINAYKTNPQGYCKALQERLSYYGCTRSDLCVFERYWNYYQLNFWGKHNWTVLYMDELSDLLETKGCRVLFLADACYSGNLVDGRSEEPQGLADAFKQIFSSGKYRNLTVVSSSSSRETSTDWTALTEDGYEENHGMFALSLLEQLNWTHSRSSFTQVKIDDTVRKIYGHLSSTPDRLTMTEAMEKILDTWGYDGQHPQINTTYLDTVLIP